MSNDLAREVGLARLAASRRMLPPVVRSQPFILGALALVLIAAFAFLAPGMVSRPNIFWSSAA